MFFVFSQYTKLKTGNILLVFCVFYKNYAKNKPARCEAGLTVCLLVGIVIIMLFDLSVKECRADDSGVVAEGAGADKRLLVVVFGVALFLDYLTERAEEVFALV